MEPIRGRTSIEDNSLRIESTVRANRISSANSLEGADFRSLYFEERKHRTQLEEELKLLRIKLKRINEQRYKKNVLCAKCWMQEPEKVIDDIKEDFQSFSELMNVRIGKKFGSFKSTLESEDNRRANELDLIENLSIFGLPEEAILNHPAEGEVEHMEGQIVLSVRSATNSVEHAAKFVFPSGMAVKRIAGEKIVQRVTELMTKSYTRQNSFLLSLKEEPGRLDHLSEQSKRLIELVNPSKKLFFVCIGTYDFTYMGKSAESFSVASLPSAEIQDKRICSSELIPNLSELSNMDPYHEVGMTQRVYCITSYLPFFSFFEDVILSILNIVKVQRLEVYKHQINDIKKIDSKFQIARVGQIYEDTIKKFNRQKIRLDSSYVLKFLNETVALSTSSPTLAYEPIEQLLPQILSIFTIDTFMDLLTLFLLEDHLVFVCQNSHILTYSIYLFVEYMYRPIGYAFESVYIVPSEEFLNAPFPVVLGLLKKKKWVDDNRIIDRFNVHTYVFIGPGGVNFVSAQNKKEKLRKRPEKLKSLLTPSFRELERSKKTNKKYTKTEEVHEYMYHSTKEERQACFMIMDCIKKYLEEEVCKWIPPKEQMLELKKKIQATQPPKNKDAHTYLIDSVISHIVQMRKQKDAFFEAILLTQSLNMYISKRCGYS